MARKDQGKGKPDEGAPESEVPGDAKAQDDAAAADAAEEKTAPAEAVDAEEKTVARDAVVVAGASEASVVAKTRRPSRTRGIIVWVLLIFSLFGIVLSGVTIWAHYTVLNTDGYIKVVGPVAKDPAAIKELSTYIAGQVVTATDLEARTKSVLPAQAGFLAGPITMQVNQFVADATDKILSTPQAYKIWIEVNRVAHQSIVDLLRGKGKYAYIQGDTVKLNALPLISQVLVWVNGKLPGALSSRINPPVIPPGTPADQAIQQVSAWLGRPLPADFGQIQLLQSSSLKTAQTAVRVFDALVIVLPIVTLLLIAAAIWLSRHRRLTAIELGIGVVVALVLTHVIINQLTKALIAQVKAGNTKEVVTNVVKAAFGPLTTITIWLIVLGAILAFVAWLVGRRDVTSAVVSTGRKLATRAVDDSDPHVSRFFTWVTTHASWLRIGGLVVGLILLLTLASSWWVFILLVVLIVLYEGAVSWIAGTWPFEHRHEAGGPAAGGSAA
jgi:hypothetical protein